MQGASLATLTGVSNDHSQANRGTIAAFVSALLFLHEDVTVGLKLDFGDLNYIRVDGEHFNSNQFASYSDLHHRQQADAVSNELSNLGRQFGLRWDGWTRMDWLAGLLVNSLTALRGVFQSFTPLNEFPQE